jgi:hypothetical protein
MKNTIKSTIKFEVELPFTSPTPYKSIELVVHKILLKKNSISKHICTRFTKAMNNYKTFAVSQHLFMHD